MRGLLRTGILANDRLVRHRVRSYYNDSVVDSILTFAGHGALLYAKLAGVRMIHATSVARLDTLMFIQKGIPSTSVITTTTRGGLPILTASCALFRTYNVLCKTNVHNYDGGRWDGVASDGSMGLTFSYINKSFRHTNRTSSGVGGVLRHLNVPTSVIHHVTVNACRTRVGIVVRTNNNGMTTRIFPSTAIVAMASRNPNVPSVGGTLRRN